MSVLSSVEKALGLPPMKEALGQLQALSEGEAGKTLDRITARLVKLSADTPGNAQAMALLREVREMYKEGSLQCLGEILKDLRPLTKSKGLNALLERLDKLTPFLDKLMKEG